MDGSSALTGPHNLQQAERIALLPRHLMAWDEDEHSCWIARKRQPNGYAVNTSWGGRPPKGKKGSAYKLIYEHVIGPVPAGLELDHLCNRGHEGCCNPFHLKATTRRENVVRSPLTIVGRAARAMHCPSGHPYEGENLMINIEGERVCKTCHTATRRRWMEKNRDEYNRRRRERYAQDPTLKMQARERRRRAAERKRIS